MHLLTIVEPDLTGFVLFWLVVVIGLMIWAMRTAPPEPVAAPDETWRTETTTTYLLGRKVPLVIEPEGTTMATFGLYKASGLVMDDLVVLKEALEKWVATPVSPGENSTSAAYREVGAQLLAEVKRSVSSYYSWSGADVSAIVSELP